MVRTALTLLLLWSPLPLAAETFLFMAEEDGCVWCARWNKEISHIYPNTAEGRAAPLFRFDISEPSPRDAKLASRVRFTPTFILVRDGFEIEGYPGEDFFWPLLAMMLERANVPLDGPG